MFSGGSKGNIGKKRVKVLQKGLEKCGPIFLLFSKNYCSP